MKLKIAVPNKKISLEEINTFEKEKNIILPEDYKHFLLECNGGKPNENRYELLDKEGQEYWIEVDYFYSLDEIEIHKNCSFCIDKKRDFLFIGYDAKNEFKIAIDLEEPFKIRFFDYCHEIFFDLLANSFDEFINNFFPKYDNEYQRLCETGNFEGIKKLIESGFDLTIKDRKNRSILRYTLFENYIYRNKYNFLELIKILLKKGVYEKGIFAESCAWGDLELAKTFIEFGININETTNEGFTPLIFACISKSYELVDLLLKNNADISVKNKFNMVAFDYVLSDLKTYETDENILIKVKKIYDLMLITTKSNN